MIRGTKGVLFEKIGAKAEKTPQVKHRLSY